jgi:ABC-type glycerol-3-phosphate transport system substrate-binding protein
VPSPEAGWKILQGRLTMCAARPRTNMLWTLAKRGLGVFLLAMALGACRQPAREPVTLSYFRLGWLIPPDELSTAAPLLQRFTQETSIHLKNVPVPESTLDQLDLSRKLLQEGGSSLDVLGIDLIWSGVLEQDLIDLRSQLAGEISSLEPQLLPSYTVNDKVVAIPYAVQVAALEYRSDLLREYGYDHPPRTWDELESMAERIQKGERAKGKKDFWGYVWQGVAAEALTCNALEWQAAEGGGRIIEDDRTISVNNPAAIRSWQRAKHWIGWISPPSVVAYRELDSMNVFDSGGAAFDAEWAISPAPFAEFAGGQQNWLREDARRARRTGWHTGRFGNSGFPALGPCSRSCRACSLLNARRNSLEPAGSERLCQRICAAQSLRFAVDLRFAQQF